MAAPKALARASLRFQPYTPARLPKGSPLPVQSADGTPIPNVTATPWSTDGSNALWELSTGDVVDIEGNVVLLRDSDPAGNPIYFSKEGNTLSADLVEMTKQGVLDEAASNAPDLPPVEPINVELEDIPVEAARPTPQNRNRPPRVPPEYRVEKPLAPTPKELGPRQVLRVEELKAIANNIGADLINGTGDPVSNVQIQQFRDDFAGANPDVQDALLNGESVLGERVRAVLVGRKPGTYAGLPPAELGTADSAHNRAQIALEQGDRDAYEQALADLQQFPDEDILRVTQQPISPISDAPPKGTTAITSEPWQEMPDAIDHAAAVRREEDMAALEAKTSQPGKQHRIRRLQAQRDAGMWDSEIEGKTDAQAKRTIGEQSSILSTPYLEGRTTAGRAAEQVAADEARIAGLRDQIKYSDDDKQIVRLMATLERIKKAATRRAEGIGSDTPSQLETAQGLALQVGGFMPSGDMVRTHSSIDPLDRLVLQEEKAASGQVVPLHEIRESFNDLTPRDRAIQADPDSETITAADAESAAAGRGGGGRVRGGRNVPRQIEGLLALLEETRTARVPSRSEKGRPNLDALGRQVYTPTGRLSVQTGPRSPDGLVDQTVGVMPTAQSLFTGPERYKLHANLKGVSDRLAGLVQGRLTPGELEQFREQVLRVGEIVFGAHPEDLPPLSTSVPTVQQMQLRPPQTSRQYTPGIQGPQPPVIAPDIMARVQDWLLEKRSEVFPEIDPRVRFDPERGWHVGEASPPLTPAIEGPQYIPQSDVNARAYAEMGGGEDAPDALPPVEGNDPSASADELPPVEGNDPTAAMGDTPSPDEDWVPDHPIDEDMAASPDGDLPPVEPIADDDLLDDMLVRADLLREDIRAAMESGDMEGADALQQELDVLEGSIADHQSGGGAPPLDETLDPLEASATPIDDTGPQQRKPQGTPKAKPQPQAKQSKPQAKRSQAKKATPKAKPNAPNAQPQSTPQPQAKKSTPKAKPQPQAKKATPKAKQSTPKAKQSQPKSKTNSKQNPNQPNQQQSKNDNGFLKAAGGTVAVGGGLVGIGLLGSGGNEKQPIDDVLRRNSPQGSQQPPVDKRAAEERLRSMIRSKRRGYQTGQEPIGRGSF